MRFQTVLSDARRRREAWRLAGPCRVPKPHLTRNKLGFLLTPAATETSARGHLARGMLGSASGTGLCGR